MNQIKLLFTLCLFSLLVVSCGDDDDTGNVNCNNINDVTGLNNAIVNEIAALSTAGMNYALDMSDANCQAYKDAFEDYIDILKSLEDCANDLGTGSQWQQDLTEAEAAIDNLC